MLKAAPVFILFVLSAMSLSLAPATVLPQDGEVVGLYRNATEGFSVTLPDGWVGEELDSSQSLLSIEGTYLDFPAFAEVSIFPRLDDDAAQAWIDDQIAYYGPDDTISSNARSFQGADSAHQVLISALSEDGVIVYGLWTAIERGSQMFLLSVQTAEWRWSTVEPQARAFTDSFTLEAAKSSPASGEGSLFQYWGEIVSIDPALARSSPAAIVGAIFSGLVKLDTDLQVVPEIEETWDISSDRTIFTFTLRENARFHDGRPVTAEDFKYSWERALDPATESPTADTYLGDIVGTDAMTEGRATHLAGVEALDARTLEVTIKAPFPYFLSKLTYPTAYVVDRANVESSESWTDAPNGAGPFKLEMREKDELLVLGRNDDWYGGTPGLAKAVYRIFAGHPMQMYENGEIDMVGIGISNIDRARDPANILNDHLRKGTLFCTTYLGFNVTQPPFDDPKVRQALALAMEIDKEIRVSRRGLAVRAAGFVPPVWLDTMRSSSPLLSTPMLLEDCSRSRAMTRPKTSRQSHRSPGTPPFTGHGTSTWALKWKLYRSLSSATG